MRLISLTALMVAALSVTACTTTDSWGTKQTLGTGAGYLKPEFEALGADFDRRGALLDEAIAAWKATWAGVDPDGPEFGVSGHVALPPPLTAGGPPIWTTSSPTWRPKYSEAT